MDTWLQILISFLLAILGAIISAIAIPLFKKNEQELVNKYTKKINKLSKLKIENSRHLVTGVNLKEAHIIKVDSSLTTTGLSGSDKKEIFNEFISDIVFEINSILNINKNVIMKKSVQKKLDFLVRAYKMYLKWFKKNYIFFYKAKEFKDYKNVWQVINYGYNLVDNRFNHNFKKKFWFRKNASFFRLEKWVWIFGTFLQQP